jgi:soluble lytic murein transglycosylase-like protein
MRIVRLAGAVSVISSMMAGAPGLAQTSGPAEPTAIARAKMQVAALAESGPAAMRADLVAELQAAGPAGGSELTIREDQVLDRLEAAFELIPPEGDTAAPRLPRSRPAGDVELVALAYAEEPKPERRPTRGLTAIEALVHEHAEANDVPPALALALVKVESSFNPKARGRNGEIGLLQIKPQTARAMGYKGSAKALYDAETNLAWGMKYLGKAHDLAGGDTCGTLLRYNAGLDAKRASKGSNKFCSKVKKVMAQRA